MFHFAVFLYIFYVQLFYGIVIAETNNNLQSFNNSKESRQLQNVNISNAPWFTLRRADIRDYFSENLDFKSVHRDHTTSVRYYGWQLWKIHVTNLTNPQIREFWRNYGKEVWNINEDGIDILIDAKNTGKARQFIRQTNLTYNIMINDIETAIEETYTEVNHSQEILPWINRQKTMTWNRYHDTNDIKKFLSFIGDSYADIAQLLNIGVSHNKLPMQVLRISNGGSNNPAIFIESGLQARDWLSTAAVTYAISKLTWLWERNGTKLMQNFDWYFLPIVNPDGYQYSRNVDRLWTKNRYFHNKTTCYGVNLDRNFAYQWGKAGSSKNPCNNLYHGTKYFSEPETNSIKNIIISIQNKLKAYVSFSAYGQTITYPWGDDDYVTFSQKNLHQVAQTAIYNLRLLNEAEYQAGTSYRMRLARSGNSADWVQDLLNPPHVYTVFLKDLGRYGYLMPPYHIVEAGEEVYTFIKTIAIQLAKITGI